MIHEGNSELIEGIKVVARVIESTMGPEGRKVMYGNRFSRDGITVLDNLTADGWVERARLLLTDASRSVVNKAGDGTSSTVLMVKAMLDDPPTADDVEFLLSDFVPVECTKDVLDRVSLVASNNRSGLAEMISDLVWELGKDGFVRSEMAWGETWAEVRKGYELGKGLASPVWLQYRGRGVVPGAGSLTLVDPLVALVEKNIETQEEMIRIYRAYQEACPDFSRALLLVVGGVEGAALRVTLRNLKEKQIPVIMVNSPHVGRDRYDVLVDLQHALGISRVFSKFSGYDLDKFTAADFGTASVVYVTNEDCRIEFQGDVSDRIAEIKEGIEKAEAAGSVPPLWLERISKLNGKVGVIHIGGWTAAENEYLQQVVEDGVRACQGALKEGAVPGAGWAYGRMGYDDIAIAITGHGPRRDEVYEIGRGWVFKEQTSVLDSFQVVKEVMRAAASLAREIKETKFIVT